MNAEVTPEMVIAATRRMATQSGLNHGKHDLFQNPVSQKSLTEFGQYLKLGMQPQESEDEIVKLQSALESLSPDVGRGNGSFFIDGNPVDDYWLGAVWAIASLGWISGADLARAWSKKAPERYTEEGFEAAWNSFKPGPKSVGVGSLYKYAKQRGWSYTPPVEHDVITKTRYKLLGSADIHALPQVKYRVKEIFPEQGFGAFIGPSGSGKSFLAFDMGAAVAQGKDWFGCRVTQAPVVYITLEGESGLKKRVEAWEKANSQAIPPQMYTVMQPFKLTDLCDISDMAAAVPKGSTIIIDTLNRAAPTIDENSSSDMGLVLESIKLLQQAIEGLIIIVHHTGKDASKGARGHSSLFAALDGAIEVERNANGRSWSISKSKDGADDVTKAFKLVVHELANDSDGDTRTSCTVELDSGQIFQKAEPAGKDQKVAMKLAKQLLMSSTSFGKAGSGPQTSCVKAEDLITAISNTLTTTQPNKRNNRARSILKGLCDSSHLASGIDNDEGWVWLP
jgi:hypothetical protein